MVDSAGDLFLASRFASIIRRISLGDRGERGVGSVTAVAGNGLRGNKVFDPHTTPSPYSLSACHDSGTLFAVSFDNHVAYALLHIMAPGHPHAALLATLPWSPKHHHLFPAPIRSTIVSTLLVARGGYDRSSSTYTCERSSLGPLSLASLPNELLDLIFSFIASPPWSHTRV